MSPKVDKKKSEEARDLSVSILFIRFSLFLFRLTLEALASPKYTSLVASFVVHLFAMITDLSNCINALADEFITFLYKVKVTSQIVETFSILNLIIIPSLIAV